MFDLICLWLGRGVIFAVGIILGGFFLATSMMLFWKKYGRYVWFKFKHLIPHWWKDERWYEDYTKAIEIGTFPDNRLTRKGQLARLYCSNYPAGTHTMFIWIKKKK